MYISMYISIYLYMYIYLYIYVFDCVPIYIFGFHHKQCAND